ncbi:MAG: hypothetical protein Q8L48_27850 [Archangium sp.]|nr:hypothetical protein [Archangium sp.]
MRAAAALLSLCALGCAQVSLDAAFVADEKLTWDATKYPDDAAVGLYAEDGTLIVHRTSHPSYTQRLVHRVFALQAESAYDLAEHRIPLFGKNKLTALKARHKKPDGTIVELRPQEVIADDGLPGEENATHARLFRLPNVEKGSVIEWVYVIEYPYIDTDSESEALGEYPLKSYDVWIEASKEIILEGRFYNIPVTTHARAGRSEKFMRIGAAMNDVPARPKREHYAADWTFTQPRWAYRMLRWNLARQLTPVLESWNDVIWRWAVKGYSSQKDALFEGFDERVDVGSCADVPCRVARVRDFVHQRTAYTALGSFSGARKMTEVLQSRQATAFERGLLMRRFLEEAGLTANLATYAARHSEAFDKTFPTLERFNRLLVYLPRQRGLDEGLWLDPSCESCAAGEVSSEASRVEALVFRANIIPLMDPVIVSEFRIVTAPATEEPVWRRTVDATPQANGDLRLEVKDERTERWAFERCAYLRETAERKLADDARRDALQIVSNATLLGLAPFTCSDHGAGSLERRTLELPRHLVVDDDRMYVPLKLLYPGFAEVFAEETRLQPIAFSGSGWKSEHVLRFKAPPGWRFVQGPKTSAEKAPNLSATVETTATAEGAEVKLTVTATLGYQEARDYAAYRRVGDFVRGVRLGLLELQRK